MLFIGKNLRPSLTAAVGALAYCATLSSCARDESSPDLVIAGNKSPTVAVSKAELCTNMKIESAGRLAYSPELKSIKMFPGLDPNRDGTYFLASNLSAGQDFLKLSRVEDEVLASKAGRTYENTLMAFELLELVGNNKIPRMLIFKLTGLPASIPSPSEVRAIEVFKDTVTDPDGKKIIKLFVALFDFKTYPLYAYIAELPAFELLKPRLVTTLQQAVDAPFNLPITRVIKWGLSDITGKSDSQMEVVALSLRAITLAVKPGVDTTGLAYPYPADMLNLIGVSPLFAVRESIVLGKGTTGTEPHNSYTGPSVFLKADFKKFLNDGAVVSVADSNMKIAMVPKVGQTILDYVIAGLIRGPTYFWNTIMGGVGPALTSLKPEQILAINGWQEDYKRVSDVMLRDDQLPGIRTLGSLLKALVDGNLSELDDKEKQFNEQAGTINAANLKNLIAQVGYGQGDVMGLTNPMAIRKEKDGPTVILTLSGLFWFQWDLGAMPINSSDYPRFLKDGDKIGAVWPIINDVTRQALPVPEFADLVNGVVYFGSSVRSNVDDNLLPKLKGLIDPETGILASAVQMKLFTPNGEILTPVFKATCSTSTTPLLDDTPLLQ